MGDAIALRGFVGAALPGFAVGVAARTAALAAAGILARLGGPLAVGIDALLLPLALRGGLLVLGLGRGRGVIAHCAGLRSCSAFNSRLSKAIWRLAWKRRVSPAS